MNKTELRNALIAMSVAAMPASADARTNTPTLPEQKNTTSQSNDLQRNVNIKEVSPAGKATTRHVYNWQEVAAKYNGYFEPSDFSKDAKLSKEQELEYAAILKAIVRSEANSKSAIEDKYYHDTLLGKITDQQCQTKIETAYGNPSNKTFTQLIAEERAILENDKSARKAAIDDLKNFREQDDFHKGVVLTDKVDTQIEKNCQTSKTLSAAFFMQKLSERV